MNCKLSWGLSWRRGEKRSCSFELPAATPASLIIFGDSCADRRWPNSMPQQELGVDPSRCGPLYVSPAQCRCSRGEVYWLKPLSNSGSTNYRASRSKSRAPHSLSVVAEQCTGPGSSGRRDPEVTPKCRQDAVSPAVRGIASR